MKRAGDSVPEPHERCHRRAAPSGWRHPYDHRLVRWCTGGCPQRRRCEGRTVGACCTRGVHERFGDFISSRCRCRVRRCRHRARLATFACAARHTWRTNNQGRSFGTRQRRTTSPGVRGTSQQVWDSPSCLSSTKSSIAPIRYVPVVGRSPGELDHMSQRDEGELRALAGSGQCK
jgi:hypothetical protein